MRPLAIVELEVPIEIRLQLRHALIRGLAKSDREELLLDRPMKPLTEAIALRRPGGNPPMLDLIDR